jgi:hypothetical protein
MKSNGYELTILGCVAESLNGYAEMMHGETYSLRLRNDFPRRCNAKVLIDGQHVGTFRLNAYHPHSID